MINNGHPLALVRSSAYLGPQRWFVCKVTELGLRHGIGKLVNLIFMLSILVCGGCSLFPSPYRE
jgi:hypothetical protein